MEEIDRIVARELGELEVDCSEGCSHCCHQLVVITRIADARAILRAAQQRFSEQEFAVFELELRQQAQEIAGLPYDIAQQRNWTCPLLRDGRCAVYDVRPVACRSVFSPDREFCRVAFRADSLADLPQTYQQLAQAISDKATSIQFAINDSRPVDGGFELRELLVSLLDATDSGVCTAR